MHLTHPLLGPFGLDLLALGPLAASRPVALLARTPPAALHPAPYGTRAERCARRGCLLPCRLLPAATCLPPAASRALRVACRGRSVAGGGSDALPRAALALTPSP